MTMTTDDIRPRDVPIDDVHDLLASIDSSVELLHTISGVLDIRAVFPRVSEIASHVIPHDLMTMTFHDGHGEILIEAVSTGELRGLSRLVKADDRLPESDFTI